MKSNNKLLIISLILIALIFSGCNRNDYDATEITLDGADIKIKGSKTLEFEDGVILITEGGYYRLKGYGNNIQIYIDCEEIVTLILEDVQIINDEISAINIESNSNVNIESTGKDENIIKLIEEKSKQCIKAEGRLTISGGTPFVLEGKSCIKAEMLIIQSAEINMSQIEKAIKAEYVFINDSVININSLYDKSFGIYAKYAVEFVQSNINISTIDDSIHSEEKIKIDGGVLNLKTDDDAIHATENISILSGKITIEKCLEGIEGKSIDIYGGDIFILSDNDGINAVSEEKDETAFINIHGGKIGINAYGDGLDSNGNIYINGGELFVSGAYGGNNNAIDFDEELIIDGGLVVAAGNNKEAKPPSEKSNQNSVMIIYDTAQKAEIGVALTNEFGTIIFAADIYKPYECLIISLPELELQNEYYIYYTDSLSDNYIYQTAQKEINLTSRSYIHFEVYSNVTFIRR